MKDTFCENVFLKFFSIQKIFLGVFFLFLIIFLGMAKPVDAACPGGGFPGENPACIGYMGDLNFDRRFNNDDYNLMIQMVSGVLPCIPCADFDCDGACGPVDLNREVYVIAHPPTIPSVQPEVFMPQAPVEPICEALSSESLRWSFTDISNNETGFRLYENNDLIYTTGEEIITDLQFIEENGVAPNTFYENRNVRTFNGSGESMPLYFSGCYTFANQPLIPIEGEISAEGVVVVLNSGDNNSQETEYAIWEQNNELYVQADKSLAVDPFWQTYDDWGGEQGVLIDYSRQPFDTFIFQVKAQNGAGVETDFSEPLAIDLAREPENVLLVADKNVAINFIDDQFSLLGAKFVIASSQRPGLNNTFRIMMEFSFLLNLILLVLFAFLLINLFNSLRFLKTNGKKFKLILDLLSKESAYIFSLLAKKNNQGTFKCSYDSFRQHHQSAQVTFLRALGLIAVKLVILTIVFSCLIVINHSGSAQIPDYSQSGKNVTAGDKLSYIINFNNEGTSAAKNVVLTDNLDQKIDYILGTAKLIIANEKKETGITFNADENKFEVIVGDLEPQTVGYFTFDALVKDGFLGQTIFNRAEVKSDNFQSFVTDMVTNDIVEEIKPVCGDGVVNGSELCDPLANPTGCLVNELCVDCSCQPIITEPVCGDGVINGAEICDPLAEPSGCFDNQRCVNCVCQEIVETQFICGDGVVNGNEECDASAEEIGCLPGQYCQSCVCQNITIPISKEEICGDGIISQNEQCDPLAKPNGCRFDEICQACFCNEKEVAIIVPEITNIDKGPVGAISLAVNDLIKAVADNSVVKFSQEKFFDNPQVEEASQNIATPALITVAALNTIPTAITLASNVIPYLHLIFTEPFLIFFRRRRKKWGVVYDSLNKLPLGLVVVRLFSKKDKRLVQTKVTDKQGRYLMIVKEPGDYYITASKPDYDHPTRYLKGQKQDINYADLYHGDYIKVTENDSVITANIPLDPKDKKALPIKDVLRNYFINNFRLILSYLGITLSVLVFIIIPNFITGTSLIVHIILFLFFRRLIVPPKPKSWGIVFDKKTKKPLSLAVVRIFETKFNKLLETQVTDNYGRYSFLVGNNKYQLLTEKPGYKVKEVKKIDLVKQEEIIDLDIALEPAKTSPILAKI